jgi:hypothetical protein
MLPEPLEPCAQPLLQEAEEHAAAAELAARQLAATVTIQAAWRGFKVSSQWWARVVGV